MRYTLLLLLAPVLLILGSAAKGQAPLVLRDPAIKGPQTFAMIVGVSKYKFVRPLTYADKDAELFRDYLRSPGGGSLKEDNIFCLLNDQAINSNFWGKGFQWLKAKQLQKGDRLFIYLAGHGDAIDEDQFFFLGYDCNPEGDKNNYLVGGTIQLFNLKKKIVNETAKGVEVFFIMDACRSNELPGGTEGQNFLNTAITEKNAGEIIMLATAAGEESLEDASIGTGHGLFTYYLVDGLSGLADSIGGRDNKITYQEIQTYVDKNVPSVAQQRFKRKQDPYFCCNVNSDRVIGRVDTAYLQKWLKTKRQQNRGGSNSFYGDIDRPVRSFFAIDTALVETYNRFYRAVRSNNLTGRASAEEYFQQLNRKYPGNPYTLDARSTLAVEYINAAQAKVDRYLGCADEGSAKEKQGNFEAALNLEKAIALVREDDEDFARSLYNRMYFLKASGDLGPGGSNGDISVAFQNAYAALAIDKNGAYIQNKLAQLHLQNGNKDSASYYANKAVKTAPNWRCALLTLALVQKETGNNNDPDNNKPGNKKPGLPKKFQFGGVIGGGLSKPSLTDASRSSANDTLNTTGVKGKTKFDIGIIGQINFSSAVSIRPSLLVSIEQSDIGYERRSPNGALTAEIIPLKTTSFSIPIPFVFRLSSKNIAPFISAGPTFSYTTQKTNNSAADLLTTKPFVVLGDVGVGVDIGLLKSHIIISPELKYSRGINDSKDDQNTSIYSRIVSNVNKQAFTFSLYIRGR